MIVVFVVGVFVVLGFVCVQMLSELFVLNLYVLGGVINLLLGVGVVGDFGIVKVLKGVDVEFVDKVVMVGKVEVQVSQFVLKQVQLVDVWVFVKWMVVDYGKVNVKFIEFVVCKGMKLQVEQILDFDVEVLCGKSGYDFDIVYFVVVGFDVYQKVVVLFEDEVCDGKDV